MIDITIVIMLLGVLWLIHIYYAYRYMAWMLMMSSVMGIPLTSSLYEHYDNEYIIIALTILMFINVIRIHYCTKQITWVIIPVITLLYLWGLFFYTIFTFFGA